MIAFITSLALRRRSVTVLAVILVLASGIYTYSRLPVELFPEVEFPLVTVTTFYPSSNPESVAENVTVPLENAVTGIDGLDNIQSISTESQSIIIATFEFGTDMEEVENIINSKVGGLRFPDGVSEPIVGRINPDAFPVIRFSVSGEREIVELQEILETSIMPKISGIDGIANTEVSGDVEQRILITVDPDRLLERGVSLFQVSQALRENNITFPGGAITSNGQVLPVKTTHRLESLDELRELVIPRAFAGPPTQAAGPQPPVRLADVADVQLGVGLARSISRTNGKPSISVSIFKDPDANTIDVTSAVEEAIENLDTLPPDVEAVVVYNDGPQIQAQIDTLEQEAVLGLSLASIVVFVFFLTVRPNVLRGVFRTLRPTLVIVLSIPLSIFTGVLLMSWQGLALNFMTLGGLAISVGRVVDDSIVVLENVYRNIEGGRDRWRAALEATVEVGPAITASTLATIAVFAPLAFIQGLVGAFFFPFALAVSFALIASLVVSLTAVPVLGAYLLRPGDLPEGVGEGEELPERETWMQRIYVPMLRWSLNHKALTLLAAIVIAVGSLGLLRFIPVNLFSSGDTQFVTINMVLPPGTPAEATLAAVSDIESEVADVADIYDSTVGATSRSGGQNFAASFNQATVFISLKEDAPEDILERLRENLPSTDDRRINIRDIGGGPPAAGLAISITGRNYRDILAVALALEAELATIDGIEDVTSDVSEARDEVIVEVDPERAAALGLSAQTVAFQINQFLVGQTVTQVELGGSPVEVVLSGAAGRINSVETISALMIAGPAGVAPLSEIATVEVVAGPVTITRTDGLRSASISGAITVDDTQVIGEQIQAKIDALDLPPGVTVTNAGVFSQITEGFEDIFIAMAVGVILVYLVMVGSLGSLRNPFVIVTSLPLALIGALSALAITGRSLGLPGMMGILLLIGIVVTNAVVLVSFVEQLRERGLSVFEALMRGGRIRLRPILMTAITTSFALIPLAAFSEDTGGILGAELATVVIGGLVSSTLLTLLVVPVVYTLANQSIPGLFRRPQRRTPAIERVEVAE